MEKIKFFLIVFVILFSCCKDENAPEEKPLDPIIEQPLGESMGFFSESWKEKKFIQPEFNLTDKVSSTATTAIRINMSDVRGKVLPSLFGNNVNTYMGQMVNEPVLLDHISSLTPHILRFPGGNLSSIYFWNLKPGEKPLHTTDVLVNSEGVEENVYFWAGKNPDSWTISLDNYYAMLNTTHNTGMITVNYGYARYGTGTNPVADAAHLAADWVRYDKGKTKYWEIGNESFGPWQAGYRIDLSKNQDKQPEIITGEIYGKHFKVFADSMRKAAVETGASIKIGAQLIHQDASNSYLESEKNWNKGYFSAAGDQADFYIVHDYYTPFKENSSVDVILSSAETETKNVMDWMKKTTTQGGVSMKPIAMTEWNIFAEGSQQMVSNIAGIHAVLVLGEFIKNQFGAACRWDLANGWENGNDHGLFNMGDEPGNVAKWNPRPAFFYMYYFSRFFGDKMTNATTIGTKNIVAYSSSFSSGEAAVILVNKGKSDQVVEIDIQNYKSGEKYYWYCLTGGNDNNSFSRKVYINGKGPDGVSGGPSSYKTIPAYANLVKDKIIVNSPALSAIYLMVDKN